MKNKIKQKNQRLSESTESKENISHIKSFKKHINLSFFRWHEKKPKEKLDKQ
jgi:hypothetical protein